MVNSSLAYEILLYINSFYFGLFATCELGTLILKSVLISMKYEEVPGQGVGKRLGQDYGVLVALFIIEAARLFIGRKGSLSEREAAVSQFLSSTVVGLLLTQGINYFYFPAVRRYYEYEILTLSLPCLCTLILLCGIEYENVPVMFSVLLTVPSIVGVVYLLKWQVVVLRIEYIWCTLMLSLQTLEFIFASMFIVTMCRGPSYD